MKKLVLFLVLITHYSAMANYTVQMVGFPECPNVVFSENEVKFIKTNNSPCVYGIEPVWEWDDGIVYIDNEAHTGAIPMQVDPLRRKVGEKCFSCDYPEPILIRPTEQEDGTFLDEEICPNRELLLSEKCDALRVSKLKESK